MCGRICRLVQLCGKYTGGGYWSTIGESDRPKKEIIEAFKTYQSLIATLAGLSSGFSFTVIVAEKPEYTIKPYISPLKSRRDDVFSTLIYMSFLFGVVSLVVSATLYGLSTMITTEQLDSTLKKVKNVIDIPLMMYIISIILIIVGSIVHIGGHYDSIVLWISIIITALLSLYYIYLAFIIAEAQLIAFDEQCNQTNKSIELQNQT
mmetsp:Transcript_69222/g.84879  ORF Transcript_69222/g.84879 Transcript_69222/m.84879 type:complete len:206 (+) Transcript_69222:74-691(+)